MYARVIQGITGPPPTPAAIAAKKLIADNHNALQRLHPGLQALAKKIYDEVTQTPVLQWKRIYYDATEYVSSGSSASTPINKTELYLESDMTTDVLHLIDTSFEDTELKSEMTLLHDARWILTECLLSLFDKTSGFLVRVSGETLKEAMETYGLESPFGQKVASAVDLKRLMDKKTKEAYGMGCEKIIVRVYLKMYSKNNTAS